MVSIDGLKEYQTLSRISNESFARFGDGELKLIHGEDSLSQTYNDEIAEMLRSQLESANCYIGMTYVHPNSPRKEYWEEFMKTHPIPDGEYGSSFITRMDEAPWLDTDNYRKLLKKLWKGKDVVLARGEGSLTPEMLVGAKSVTEVKCSSKNAFPEIDRIEKEIGTPPFAILCVGAVATILADRLTVKGVHAIDLGYIGKFL